MSINYYRNLKYKTPNFLKNSLKDKSILIIGSGNSTAQLLSYKYLLKNYFDAVLGLNLVARDFEDILDYHMIMEIRPTFMAEELSKNYRKDLYRIFNYKSIKYFSSDMNIIKARREYFKGRVKLRKYTTRVSEGLYEHKSSNKNIYYGTVLLQAIHFACILGVSKIYMIGADLMFKGDVDHYYGGKFYREPTTTETSRSPIIEKMIGDKKIITTAVFYKSAKIINNLIVGQMENIGIQVFDFSDGLINKAKKLNVEEFFGAK